MLGAGLQPALRQRPGPENRRIDPKIRRVFDQWKGTPALQSNLEKNAGPEKRPAPGIALGRRGQERKPGQAEHRPAVRREHDEPGAQDRLSQAGRRCSSPTAPGRGFPAAAATTTSLSTSRPASAGCGIWASTTVAQDLALKALGPPGRLDRDRSTGRSSRPRPEEENHLSPTIALYLYGRSFFLEEQPDRSGAPARRWITSSARRAKYWLKLDNRQSQAHLALALKRFGDTETAREDHALDEGAEPGRRGAGPVSGASSSCPGGGTGPRSRRRP